MFKNQARATGLVFNTSRSLSCKVVMCHGIVSIAWLRIRFASRSTTRLSECELETIFWQVASSFNDYQVEDGTLTGLRMLKATGNELGSEIWKDSAASRHYSVQLQLNLGSQA